LRTDRSVARDHTRRPRTRRGLPRRPALGWDAWRGGLLARVGEVSRRRAPRRARSALRYLGLEPKEAEREHEGHGRPQHEADEIPADVDQRGSRGRDLTQRVVEERERQVVRDRLQEAWHDVAREKDSRQEHLRQRHELHNGGWLLL